MACAKEMLGAGAFLSYMPFVQCLDNHYGEVTDASAADFVAQCAASTGLNLAQLKQCYDSAAGDQASINQAMSTVAHPFCPHVVVNGVAMEQPITGGALLTTVCNALQPSVPAGCPPGLTIT